MKQYARIGFLFLSTALLLTPSISIADNLSIQPLIGSTLTALPNDETGPDDDSIVALPNDADGDGVSDSQEALDDTSPTDPGSYFSRLTSPTYTLWNGYLSMINILELVNSSTTSPITIQLSLYSINGSLQHTQSINLDPSEQKDILVNQLPGFLSDSYGIIKLEYSSPISGRMSFYRSSGAQYEFAYSVPLDRTTKGKSILAYNTYQPSTNPIESAYQIFNWLSLVNLENSAKTFVVRTYSQAGTRIASRVITIPAFGRTDVDGGHGLLGPNVVGIHQIRPEDANTAYIAQLIRYGSKSNPGEAINSFTFAFPINSQSGNGRSQIVPISRQFSESNWLELINTRNITISVTVNFYLNLGFIEQRIYNLAPFSQTHISIEEPILIRNERGYAEIIPDGSHSILAQSMSYFKNDSGSMEAMFGIPSKEAQGTAFNGSFNLYLLMKNWIALSNLTSSPISVTINTKSSAGSGTASVEIQAHRTVSIDVGASTQLLATQDNYGSVRIIPSQANALWTNLTRIKPEGTGVDFAFPTEMRAE